MISDPIPINARTELFFAYSSAAKAAETATPEQLDEAAYHQYAFRIVYAAERILAASVPGLSDLQRWEIAKEVGENYRSGEQVIETVRRWIPDDWKESLKRNAKGELIANPLNGYLLLRFHPKVRDSIRLNLFTKQIEVRGGLLAGRKDIDDIVTAAQDWIYRLEDCYIPFTDLGRRLVMVARENEFDPIQDYLRGLKWDGVPRLGTWLIRYAGVEEDSDGYVREVSKRWLMAAVARGLCPGSKTDVVLVAEGPQGIRKSACFEALGGSWYADAAIALGDKDSKMLASAAWILELPEMESLNRASQNGLKAFLTTRDDTFRLPYGRATIRVPRRCIFATTTNDHDDGYFTDPTGHRRYWPVLFGEVTIADLIRDRDQLWAEAVAIYLASETCPRCAESRDTVWGQKPRCEEHRWWLSKEMQKIADRETKKREREDPIESLIRKWWSGLIAAMKSDPVTTAQVAKDALGLMPDRLLSHGVSIAIGRALLRLGFTRSRPRNGSSRTRIYTPPTHLAD